jgi:hypothetical protein
MKRRLGLTLLIALGSLATGTGVASADNCTGPADTQNCMAAINFVAAAAAAAAAGGVIAIEIRRTPLRPESASEEEKISAKRSHCMDLALRLRDLAEDITARCEKEIKYKEFLKSQRESEELLYRVIWRKVFKVTWTEYFINTAEYALAAAALAAVIPALAGGGTAAAGTAAAGTAAAGTAAGGAAAEASLLPVIAAQINAWVGRVAAWLATTKGTAAAGTVILVAEKGPLGPPSFRESQELSRELERLARNLVQFKQENDRREADYLNRVGVAGNMLESYRALHAKWTEQCADTMSSFAIWPPEPSTMDRFFLGAPGQVFGRLWRSSPLLP